MDKEKENGEIFVSSTEIINEETNESAANTQEPKNSIQSNLHQ